MLQIEWIGLLFLKFALFRTVGCFSMLKIIGKDKKKRMTFVSKVEKGTRSYTEEAQSYTEIFLPQIAQIIRSH